MSALSNLINQINASGATAEQKKSAIAAAKQANTTGKGVSKNETTYILNNIATVNTRNLGTAATRIAANATFASSSQAPAPVSTPVTSSTTSATSATTNFDVFKAELQTAFGVFDPTDNTWLQEIWTAGQNKLSQGIDSESIPDMLLDDTSLTNYRSRFSGLLKLRELSKTQSVSYVPNIRNYLESERTLTEKLKYYGLNDLATQRNIADIIGNDVSITEAEGRIVDGYLAIKNADSALTEQLRKEFPTLNDADFVSALLSRKGEGPEFLKTKIARAGVATGIAASGLESQIGAEELRKRGVTRETALEGFKSIKSQQAGVEQAARMFGDTTEKTELQKQLEEETFGISGEQQNVKRLKSQARAQFAGQSGITSGSLSRKRQT